MWGRGQGRYFTGKTASFFFFFLNLKPLNWSKRESVCMCMYASVHAGKYLCWCTRVIVFCWLVCVLPVCLHIFSYCLLYPHCDFFSPLDSLRCLARGKPVSSVLCYPAYWQFLVLYIFCESFLGQCLSTALGNIISGTSIEPVIAWSKVWCHNHLATTALM